ncbi:MAG: hypothetical protein F4205_06120 [Gemmatimonadetes bacterium]|nr:hypothetical protein [Gemmatimonadota bacterium]MXX70904.1 hypothetical protein [Gemmatimonadota bacterium]MYC91168.1 hypothetical protein [Gemmatimonadota bacterium]MYG35054.1 hypothetical protein [Gemmatimonadota bacterium]
MRRTVALIAFVAISWSQLVALRCDMGTDAPDGGHHATAAPPPGPHDAHHPPDGSPMTPHGQHHGDSEGCLMIPACGASSVRPARAVAVMRLPAVFEGAGSYFSTIPVAADLAVEPPPPRHAA